MTSGMFDGLGRAILATIIFWAVVLAAVFVVLYEVAKWIFSHLSIGWN